VKGGASGILDRRPRLATGVVTAPHHTGGIVEFPHEVTYEAVAAGSQENGPSDGR
jgi:hypothetical protein